MQRSLTSLTKSICSKFIRKQNHIKPIATTNRCDVFINHRGIDTKRTISGLLYDHFYRLGLSPFLDSKNMKPGDKLFENIDYGIRNCKIGICVFSPRYCESYFCLHELALMMECRIRVIPIFCDVKPSQLRVMNDGVISDLELKRYEWAIEQAKLTVGLTFDTLEGDWSEFLTIATEAVVKNLVELEDEQLLMNNLHRNLLWTGSNAYS